MVENARGFDALPTHQVVEWMHPSWRDLVIEHLASFPHARRQFLSSCGAAGIGLALSTAGGSRGERHRPLLVDEEDWQSLRRRVTHLIENPAHVSNRALLNVFVEMAESANESGLGSLDDQQQILLRDVCEACRSRWASVCIPSVDELIAYSKISTYVSPLPAWPQCDRLWSQLVQQVRVALKSIKLLPTESDAIKSWLQLVAVLQDNEPRFLRQMKYPDEFSASFEDFASRAKDEIESYDPVDPDECGACIDVADAIADVASEIAKNLPALRCEWEALENQATELGDQWRELRAEMSPTDEDYGDDREPSDSEEFDIGQLFSDL